MKNSPIIILLMILLSSFSEAQNFESYLEQIEENNPMLQAAQTLEETQKLQARTGIYPKPFSVNYGYFPDNNTVVDQKQTLNAMQSFHLPWVYKDMSQLADEKGEMAAFTFQAKRLNVLYQAQTTMIKMVYRLKMKERLLKRLKNAENHLKGYQRKVEMGDASVMDVNKAKFHMLRVKKALDQNEVDLKNLQEELSLLNGGEELDFKLTDYPVFSELKIDSLLAQKLEVLPSVKAAGQRKNISRQNLDLEKSLNGPDIHVGYGSEIVGNSSFRGVIVGASIPLWTNKNKVKAAKSAMGYAESEYQNIILKIQSDTRKQYNMVQSVKQSLDEYSSVYDNVKGIELLKMSLELEQISVLDYYRELEYYYDIYDEYLTLERNYFLALAELYRYQL